MFYFDPLYFLFLAPGLLLAAWAQMRVRSAYDKGAKVNTSTGMNGAEIARAILDAHGLNGVRVEPSRGFLSDHYDPRGKVLRLSPGVYQGRTAAAAGIAAHEAGHALQDADGYTPLRLRSGIVPIAAVSSNLMWLFMIAGLLLGGLGAAGGGIGALLLYVGVGMCGAYVLAQLITLPVEYDASRRAKDLLSTTGILAPGAETTAMKRVLNAAALTYVAAALTAMLTLAYFVLRSGLLGGRD